MNTGGGNPNSAIARIQPDVYNASRAYINALDFYVGDWNNNNNVGNALMSIMTTGNVGIGTTSPGYRLDVNGTGRFVGVGFGSNGIQSTGANGGNGIYTVAGGSAGSGVYAFTNDLSSFGGTFEHTGAGQGIALRVIGYSTFSQAATFSSSVTATQYNISNSNQTISIANTSDIQINAAAAGSNILFRAAGDERMRITSGGNVGIGTTSPTEKLHIVGSNALQIIQSTTGGQNSTLKFITTARTWGIGANMGLSNSNLEIYDYTASANRLTIDSSGNVGIGTTSPGVKLDVNGDGRFSGGLVYLGNYSGNPEITLQATGNSWSKINFYDNNSTEGLYIRTDGESYGGTMTFGARWDDDESKIVFKMYQTSAGASYDQRVGIGTTSPNRTLSVNGIVGISSATANTQQLVFSVDSGASYITSSYFGSSSYVPMYLETGGAVRLAIQTNGNIGIGTTTDAGYKLDVNGTARTLDLSIKNSANAETLDLFLSPSVFSAFIDYPTSRDLIFRNKTSGTALTLASTGAATFSSSVTAQNEFAYYFQRTSGTPSDLYSISANSASAYLYNHTTSNVLMTWAEGGNVGIGTTSPGVYKLSITSSDYRVMSLNSTYGQMNMDFANSGVYFASIGSGNSQSSDAGITASDFGIGTVGSATNKIIFATGTGYNTRMVILPSGNVGIGTTSPSHKLHVEGNILSSNVIYWNNGFGALSWDTGLVTMETNTATAISFKTNGTDRMRILAGGNVGIGTTSPSQKLDVSGVTSTQGLYIPGLYSFGQASSGIEMQLTSASYNAIRFFQGSDWTGVIHSFGRSWVGGVSVGMVNIQGYNGVTIGAWDAPTATFLSSGNVGIGTTSPVLKLDVVSGTTLYPVLRLQNTDTNGYSGAHLYSSAGTLTGHFGWANGSSTALSDKMYFGTIANKPVVFTTNDSEKVRIAADGNVGIGTTNPQYKLHVAGNGAFTGVAVSNPDTSGTFNRSSIDISSNQITLGFTAWGQGSVRAGTAWVQTVNNWPLVLGVNDAEVMRLAISGNVGIGTTSPSNKLTVTGGSIQLATAGERINFDNNLRYILPVTSGDLLRIAQNSFANGIEIGFDNGTAFTSALTLASTGAATFSSSVTAGGDIQSNGIYRDYQGEALLQTTTGAITQLGSGGAGTPRTLAFLAGNAERMRITAGGNVGIGTTSPGGRLDVQASGISTFSYYFKNSSGGYGGGVYNTGGNNTQLYLATSAGTENVLLNSSGSSYFNGGNVGIGTTSPSGKLHTVADTTSEDTAAIIQGTGVLGSGLHLAATGTNGRTWRLISTGTSSTPGAGTLGFYDSTAALYRFVINTGGNVGIGTTSPSYKLHVEGNTSGISIYASHDIAAFSDITVKKEVKRIENAIEKVKELNGYTYVRTDDETGTRRAGVIAQEVQKVLPEVVSANPDGTLNVAYSNMIALLIEGMKEQQKEIDELKKLLKK
jgi:hypothetical protein